MKFILCVLLHILTFSSQAKKIDLFIMAGQSNMQGWRSNAAAYPADITYQDINIPFYFEALNYSSSDKQWETLGPQLGHFQKGHFGPEVTFARALLKSNFNPAIFKYSSGGSSIKTDWKAPGHNGIYDNMLVSLKKAVTQLENQGHTVIPRAFIWVQGESDAKHAQLANEYYWHLKKMINHLRQNISNPNLHIILSVDELHPHIKINKGVAIAQKKLALEDSQIAFMSMIGLEKYDVTHLTAKGTINQGNRLFKTYMTTINN